MGLTAPPTCGPALHVTARQAAGQSGYCKAVLTRGLLTLLTCAGGGRWFLTGLTAHGWWHESLPRTHDSPE